MEQHYLIKWGTGEEFRCTSIQSAMGHIMLQLLKGYSEVSICIAPSPR